MSDLSSCQCDMGSHPDADGTMQKCRRPLGCKNLPWPHGSGHGAGHGFGYLDVVQEVGAASSPGSLVHGKCSRRSFRWLGRVRHRPYDCNPGLEGMLAFTLATLHTSRRQETNVVEGSVSDLRRGDVLLVNCHVLPHSRYTIASAILASGAERQSC